MTLLKSKFEALATYPALVRLFSDTKLRWPFDANLETDSGAPVVITSYAGSDAGSALTYLTKSDLYSGYSFSQALEVATSMEQGIYVTIPTLPLLDSDGDLLTGSALEAVTEELKAFIGILTELASISGVEILSFEVGKDYLDHTDFTGARDISTSVNMYDAIKDIVDSAVDEVVEFTSGTQDDPGRLGGLVDDSTSDVKVSEYFDRDTLLKILGSSGRDTSTASNDDTTDEPDEPDVITDLLRGLEPQEEPDAPADNFVQEFLRSTNGLTAFQNEQDADSFWFATNPSALPDSDAGDQRIAEVWARETTKPSTKSVPVDSIDFDGLIEGRIGEDPDLV